ncbi:hypothetical protein OAS19_06135 [Altererythrobacter sp.]|nr:hypothetical protein [Altererythrobacter sp.]
MSNVNYTQSGQMAAALAPLQRRLPQLVEEREILRLVSIIPASTETDGFSLARAEILKWARKRAGSVLPEEAWQGAEFELPVAGRATLASCVETENALLWSLRGDDPDKRVAGRIWSTEMSLGRNAPDGNITFGLRLLVNSSERQLVIEPAVPGPVLQIAEVCGLMDGPVPVRTTAHHASDFDNVDELIGWLQNPIRKLPIIVATGDERESDPNIALLDVDDLAKALCGLAHVVSLPAPLCFRLSDELGKEHTVFHGGIRIYEPGFDLLADPRGHRLILGHVAKHDPARTAAELRRGIARESLRRSRLGQEIVSFAAVRSAAVQQRKLAEVNAGVDDGDRFATLEKQVDVLGEQIEDLGGQVDQALQLSEEESERADIAERLLHSSNSRIEMLEIALVASGSADVEAPAPTGWDDFTQWCDSTFAGRLVLASSARRGVKKPEFLDLGMVVESIRWLARDARTRFMEGGGTLANIPVMDGVVNAPCGADEYVFDYQARRLVADWHLKNTGNTRQPERCLRIYYTFDEQTRQIIISDMPAHRRTAAS